MSFLWVFYDEKKRAFQSFSPRPGTRRYRKLWTPFLKALAAHAKEKGWYDQIYIGIDERRHMEKAYDLIDAVTGATEVDLFFSDFSLYHFKRT